MGTPRKLFDPLFFLQRELRLKVWINRQERILLDGLGRLGPDKRRQALWVVNTYDKLLRLQLKDPGRPSVYKLIAQGKLKIQRGRFVKP
jgi:hypothetical protein